MLKLIHKIRHSLALRLMLVSFATLIGVVAIFLVSSAAAFHNQFQQGLLPNVYQYQEYLYADIGAIPDRTKAQALADRLNLEIYIKDVQGEWSSTGIPFTNDHLEFRTFQNEDFEHTHDRGQFYLRKITDSVKIIIVIKREEKKLSSFLKLIATLSLLGVIALSYLATRRIFKPLDIIRASVKRIGHGDLSERITLIKKDELHDLATSINTMAGDIETMLNAKRTLLLAISHELRSPITRSRVTLELMPESDYRERIKRDLIEVETLLSDLLEGEKLQPGHSALDLTNVNISSLVSVLINKYFQSVPILVNIQPATPEIAVDYARISLLLKNLLDNALRYNRLEYGDVELTVSTTSTQLSVSVKDYGVGIEEPHIAHLTEAFYRVDPARQRKTGGYGLGLYFCYAIAKAHHASLSISSEIDKGTVIELLMPL